MPHETFKVLQTELSRQLAPLNKELERLREIAAKEGYDQCQLCQTWEQLEDLDAQICQWGTETLVCPSCAGKTDEPDYEE